MRRVALAAALAVLLVMPAAAQTRRDDPLQAEQRKLQQTQKQLKEERERAAAARARETSLLAELEEIERRLAAKKSDVARLETRIKKAQSDVQMYRGEISKLEKQRAGQTNALGSGWERVADRIDAKLDRIADAGPKPSSAKMVLSDTDELKHQRRVEEIDREIARLRQANADGLVDLIRRTKEAGK